MKEVFGNKVVLVQYPINPGTGFNAMIDVLLMKMYNGDPTVVFRQSPTFLPKKWKKRKN